MKNAKLLPALFAAVMGFSGLAMANCADDAIAVCNEKHPNPDANYGAYNLCIQAQLGQKCPHSAVGNSVATQFQAAQPRPSVPTSPVRRVEMQQAAPEPTGR